jgi:hypothetical protein
VYMCALGSTLGTITLARYAGIIIIVSHVRGHVIYDARGAFIFIMFNRHVCVLYRNVS